MDTSVLVAPSAEWLCQQRPPRLPGTHTPPSRLANLGLAGLVQRPPGEAECVRCGMSGVAARSPGQRRARGRSAAGAPAAASAGAARAAGQRGRPPVLAFVCEGREGRLPVRAAHSVSRPGLPLPSLPGTW